MMILGDKGVALDKCGKRLKTTGQAAKWGEGEAMSQGWPEGGCPDWLLFPAQAVSRVTCSHLQNP
jgi:hypothetical protein